MGTRFLALALAFTTCVLADRGIVPSFPYDREKIRGVNLAGWLVLEPWVTPSLFDKTNNADIVDEKTFCQYQAKKTAEDALQKHWDTFYFEKDFQWMAEAGLNHVRIPIGYWAFTSGKNDPYIQGQLPYLERAIHWAGKYGLKVIIDLHGPEERGANSWYKNGKNFDRLNAVVQEVMSRYATKYKHIITAIEPMHESKGTSEFLPAIRKFYQDSYRSVRWPPSTAPSQSETLLVIHDAGQTLNSWKTDLQPPVHHGVALDTHRYHVFADHLVSMTRDQHLREVCANKYTLAEAPLWAMVGEWSAAHTDCAKYINGRGVGSRYDGSFPGSKVVGSCADLSGAGRHFSRKYKGFLRQFWETQALTYNRNSRGWIQTTWKTEAGAAEEWSFVAGLRYKWIPRHVNNTREYEYLNACSD